ncbi:cytochrome b [Rhodobacteraceae bacterium 2CG4]|uniref:Cytochrome b n=1 Tax=Halovulum marinum TaxID=2662447 RepID=A0A6L5YUM0_9RHOB|nr:cytochrome b [Halovulum marinum]MSU88126.1 cytochrome b [Halovulum marinum]
MALRDGPGGWGWPSRVLHWGMAALIAAMLGLGVYMIRIERDLIVQYQLIQLHKSLGATALLLAVLRLGWRLAQPGRPALPAAMPAWQRRAATASHLALYALMLALPVSGWLTASASPLNDADAVPFRIPNMVFGLFELPDPFPRGTEALEAALGTLHRGLALTLALLLTVHVAAAVKHHLHDRDQVLRRMWRG